MRGRSVQGLVDFLTDDEAAAYGCYTGAPSRADLERVFFLDDEDRCPVRRGPLPRLVICLTAAITASLAGALRNFQAVKLGA